MKLDLSISHLGELLEHIDWVSKQTSMTKFTIYYDLENNRRSHVNLQFICPIIDSSACHLAFLAPRREIGRETCSTSELAHV